MKQCKKNASINDSFCYTLCCFSSLGSNEMKETSFVIFFSFLQILTEGKQLAWIQEIRNPSPMLKLMFLNFWLLTWALVFSKLMKCVCVFLFIAFFPPTYKSRTYSDNFGCPNYKKLRNVYRKKFNCP